MHIRLSITTICGSFLKMKWLVVFVATIVVSINVLQAQEASKSVLIQGFDEIYRGPPIEDGPTSRAVQTEWIEQKLDNFDENNNRTWRMRYMINEEHYEVGGPMFIYVGGEWTIRDSTISRGHFVDLAKKYKAILFYPEHRFYGESRPLDNLSMESLQYLNVKQALADLAHFVEYQRETRSNLANAKVIMQGCSYSATMVTWFRRLYPTLIDGGWASSGPLLAKVDFIDYKEMVGQAVKKLGGEDCYNRVQNGFAGLETMMKNQQSSEIRSMFQLCNTFDQDNDLDLWSLFSSIAGYFSSTVQYQTGDDVPKLCRTLMAAGKNDTLALAKFTVDRWKVGSRCTEMVYKSDVNAYLDNTYALGASRPWYYQTCNEFGWYQTSGSKNQPFGTLFPKTLLLTLCEDLFGYSNSRVANNVAQTNLDFGGLDPGVSKIYTVHGALDPWSTVGLLADKGAVRITDSSHCADSTSLKDTDSDEMKASKQRIDELIGEWLSR